MKRKGIILATLFVVAAIIISVIVIWQNLEKQYHLVLEPVPSSSPTSTVEPVLPLVPVEPKAILSIDGISYDLNGTNSFAEASASLQGLPNFSVEKDSKLEIAFDTMPKSSKLTLYKDDEKIFSKEGLTILQNEIPVNGEIRGVCEADWESGTFTGKVYYNFMITSQVPVEVQISATEVQPGELIVLKLRYVDPEIPIDIQTNLDFKPNIFTDKYEHIILLPVSYYHKQNKTYFFKLTIGEEILNYDIAILEKEFTIQQLTIDTKIAAETRNDKSAAEKKVKIEPLKPVCDDTIHWQGSFIMPVDGGRVRDYDFGKRRHVNGSPTSYRHNGLDIGHDLGIPVKASNSGRILIADYLIGTGNTVIIEHGFGLKTWYYHMDELNIKTGQMVGKGDIIGTVGSTGFSTGPHLHFSTSINGVYINPLTLINEGIPLM